MVEVEIELPDETLMALALEAHRQDITLNQLILNILEESLQTHPS